MTWLLAHLPSPQPLHGASQLVIFRVKPTNPLAPIILKCAVTNANKYDILVGQLAPDPLCFGLDNWT